jgi:hypothetical protein
MKEWIKEGDKELIKELLEEELINILDEAFRERKQVIDLYERILKAMDE